MYLLRAVHVSSITLRCLWKLCWFNGLNPLTPPLKNLAVRYDGHRENSRPVPDSHYVQNYPRRTVAHGLVTLIRIPMHADSSPAGAPCASSTGPLERLFTLPLSVFSHQRPKMRVLDVDVDTYHRIFPLIGAVSKKRAGLQTFESIEEQSLINAQ